MRNLQIQYDNYFEESPTGAPADLIQLLQEQDIAEKAEYVNLVKSQLEGTDEITTAEAKIAFMSIDPGINIEIINTYLSVSFDLEYFKFCWEFYFNCENGVTKFSMVLAKKMQFHWLNLLTIFPSHLFTVCLQSNQVSDNITLEKILYFCTQNKFLYFKQTTLAWINTIDKTSIRLEKQSDC